MKRILDTVHGYIMVRDEFVRNIIDSRYFQRLRRVEQTSIRAVYPSARHDRFIHSLGVYHIGSQIVEHLKKEQFANAYWGETETKLMEIMDSYLVACLLHDIAHAPFSHSFEEYYGTRKELSDKLKGLVSNEKFTQDLIITRQEDDPAHHEYMSAYLAFSEFRPAMERLGVDAELVVRMITGVLYKEEKDTHQIQNCFISLLHGKVIDADRLDYACRDVWASGYSTSSVDIRRLVSAMHIKQKDNEYVVCYDSIALNEIEGVLNVKDFQVKYVINHHTVSYEQWLLRQAAEHMALHFFPPKDKERETGKAALGRMLNEDSLIKFVRTRVGDYVIKNISDDDLIFMIKQDTDNPYYNEWADRQYTRYPLWKSPDEFYYHFSGIDRTHDLRIDSFEEQVRACLQANNLDINNLVVKKATYKPRVKMDSLHLIVAGRLVKYTDVYPKVDTNNKDVNFYYVYIAKNGMDRSQLKDRVNRYIEALKPLMHKLYVDQD